MKDSHGLSYFRGRFYSNKTLGGKDEQGDLREISSYFLKVTAWRRGLLFHTLKGAGGGSFSSTLEKA